VSGAITPLIIYQAAPPFQFSGIRMKPRFMLLKNNSAFQPKRQNSPFVIVIKFLCKGSSMQEIVSYFNRPATPDHWLATQLAQA
jgi:hypothetical protein